MIPFSLRSPIGAVLFDNKGWSPTRQQIREGGEHGGWEGGVLNIIPCSSSALEFDTGILMVLRRHIQPELDGEARWMTPYTGEKGALPDPLVSFSFSFSYERRHEKHTIRNICK